MNFTPFVIVWALLATTVVGLALYRKIAVARDFEVLHVRDAEVRDATQQVLVAHRLEVLDRWGKLLTAVAIAYGLIMASSWVILDWIEKLPQ